MTTPIALFLALTILVAGIVDYLLYGTEHFVFLAKQFYWFLWWIKFWR